MIVATGAHNIPKTPAFAAELDPRIVQLHSAAYRNPSQLQDGDVLLVGAGNSGAELAVELCQMHRVLLSGPKLSEIPVKHGTLPFRPGFRVFRFLGHRVLSRGNPIGRKVGPKLLQEADPLIRTKSKELAEAGVERVPRVTGVENGRPVLEDGRVLDVANVIWCTGFRTDFGWIDLPVFDEDGQPEHARGVVESEPGLYFLGLVFQYSFSSDVLPGRGRDAGYVAKHIADQRRPGCEGAEPSPRDGLGGGDAVAVARGEEVVHLGMSRHVVRHERAERDDLEALPAHVVERGRDELAAEAASFAGRVDLRVQERDPVAVLAAVVGGDADAPVSEPKLVLRRLGHVDDLGVLRRGRDLGLLRGLEELDELADGIRFARRLVVDEAAPVLRGVLPALELAQVAVDRARPAEEAAVLRLERGDPVGARNSPECGSLLGPRLDLARDEVEAELGEDLAHRARERAPLCLVQRQH